VPVSPRALTLSIATVTTALLVGGASLVSVPYAVDSPGPTFDTLGEHDGVALIDVMGAASYPSEGELRFTTVRLRGGPGNPVTLLRLVDGWLDGTVTVLPVEDVLPTDQSPEEIDEINQAAMISSQENATVSALEELGYEVPTTLTVADAIEGTGAFGVIEAEDVLVAIDGDRLAGFSELSAAMAAVAPGDDVTVTVERDGEERDVELTTTDGWDGRALLGVYVDPVFDLPVDVRIQIENVGGPSAGLMFSLGIINTLTEPDETGGERIAGTGTMDLTGTVGPIGGIVQKMAGARDDGADWFLAPETNCAEAVGYEPPGLHVVAVATLAEARAAVEAIGAGEGESLRTCADAVGD
jgi:PDZ domain-containing protein